jgi:hypothetical protein
MDATVTAARAMAQAVTRWPRDRKAQARWLEATTAFYPPGWPENWLRVHGCPSLRPTLRQGRRTPHYRRLRVPALFPRSRRAAEPDHLRECALDLRDLLQDRCRSLTRPGPAAHVLQTLRRTSHDTRRTPPVVRLTYLTVLLAVVVTVIAARLAIQMLSLGSAHWRHSLIDFWLDKVTDITIFGLSILFVVWFRRARINAERRGYHQRRARGWTFWGWIVPIVSLWFPFQIMGDIWRAGLPAQQRRRTAWLPALWWTCWLLSGLSIGARAMPANLPGVPHIAANTRAVSLCFLALAGATLIGIIRTVSAGPVGSPLS